MPKTPLHPTSCLFALLLLVLSATPVRGQSVFNQVDGITVGAGLALFQGDLDSNPTHSPLKLIGNGNLRLLVGADKEFAPFRLGLEVTYDRLVGSLRSDHAFTANAVSLDVAGSYNLPIISDGLFGLYAGVGPTLIVQPTYSDYIVSQSDDDDRYRPLGSRVLVTGKVGIDFNDQIRVGMRLMPSDFVDGYAGINEEGAIDMVTSITLGYRFAR